MASASVRWLLTAVAASLIAAAGFYAVRNVYDWSDDRIAANERARVVARLNSVLEPGLAGRDLTTTLIPITDAELLGSDAPVDVFVLTDRGAPMATVFAAVAPHGYNGSIELLIGISPSSTVTGVRAVRHRETQGTASLRVGLPDGRWARVLGRSRAYPHSLRRPRSALHGLARHQRP